MKYIIIGTAGHVDHGKSALIKALTGIDTDRLKEEKVRGISIDLGFASLELSQELMAGIVDVPGHERFLKNMLAGTGGIDMAMLVIAADEGVMPQTREHLAMLQLYGIKHGLVVINKIDKVDEEWLEMVEEDIRILLKDTFLAEAVICRVSAVTGEGVLKLKENLLAVGQTVAARDSDAPFRLWIDRVFTIKGHGAVVTGSVLSGTARIGDSLMLYPGGKQVRVRGVECHSNKVERVVAGQRAAINLAGVDISEITRGMSLSDSLYGQISNIWDVMVNWQQTVDSGTRVRLHLGTGEFLGRIYSFKNSDNHYMRIILEEPLAAGAGDRGIIRLYSPQILLGGVMLIAPSKSTRLIYPVRMDLAQSLTKTNISNIVYQLLRESGSAISVSDIMRQTGYREKGQVDKSLAELVVENKIVLLDNYYIAQDVLLELSSKFKALLGRFHTAQPEQAGLSREIIRQKLRLTDKVFDSLITYWQYKKIIVVDGASIALPEHIAKYSEWQKRLLIKTEQVLADSGLNNIDVCFLGEKLSLSPEKAQSVFGLLLHQGVLVRLGDICVYRKTIQYIVSLIQDHFKNNETVTVAQLRDMLHTSRKLALFIMEYLDMNKYTVRVGDARRPSLKMLELSE